MLFQNFSQVHDGNMSGNRGDSNEASKNRRDWLAKDNILIKNIVIMQEVRENKIALVLDNSNNLIQGVDGLITLHKNVFLFGTFTDCLPVYFWSQPERFVGLMHAGWQGLSKGICESMIKRIRQVDVLKNKKIIVHIGPSIHPCCYEIQEDVASLFSSEIIERDDKLFFDLPGYCASQLKKLGVKEISINISCTCCSRKYFSHRRDGQKSGAMAAVIGMKK